MTPMAMDEQVFQRELNIGRTFERPELEEWRRLAERALRGAPLSDLQAMTHESLRIEPLYTADDALEPHLTSGALSGRAKESWCACQLYRHPDPTVTGRQMAEDVARGIDSVWIEFERAAALWPMTDDQSTSGVSARGVVCSTVDALTPLLASIDLTSVQVHLSSVNGGIGPAATFLAAARRAGIELESLDASLGYDPLGALAARGKLDLGLDRSLDLMPDLVSWAEANTPNVKAVTVSSIPYSMAGATAVHELAFCLGTGVEYLRRLTGSSLDLPVACRHLLFRMAIGRDLFMATTKMRAFRRLWARVVDACGGDADDRSTWIHAVTSPRSMTIRDPWVNILRATVESFAAAAGGADIITVLPFDSAVGPSDALARRLAANTHAIMRDESYLCKVTDPAAGSWYVERITDELATAAWSLFQRIESAGGFAGSLTEGRIHQLLDDTLGHKRSAIAADEDLITGVSSYPNPAEEPLRRDPADLTAIRDQVSRSLADRSPPADELDRLAEMAQERHGDGSIVSAALAALTADATVAEVSAALQAGAEPTRIEGLPAEREEEAVSGVSP